MSDKQNNINAAVIIEGPEAELNSKDENNPIITDSNPPNIDNLTIWVGLLDTFLAMAAGIISIPVIKSSPTIFIEIAIIAANKTVKIVLYLSGFIPSASANSWFTVAANKGFQIIFKIKRIKAPPIQINNRSFWLTANISPNSNPITSNLIEDKKPITTRPTANDEWANKPNKASPGNLVVFCNLNNIIAITEETTNTEKAILMSKKTAIVTPSKAEWDNVSPKKDNLLQIMKQPMGPVTKAIPIPANNALIKKSSSII